MAPTPIPRKLADYVLRVTTIGGVGPVPVSSGSGQVWLRQQQQQQGGGQQQQQGGGQQQGQQQQTNQPPTLQQQQLRPNKFPARPQQQQVGTRIQGRGSAIFLRRRFNPKTGKVEVIQNGVISRSGYLNLSGNKLNRRQALRNYRYR